MPIVPIAARACIRRRRLLTGGGAALLGLAGCAVTPRTDAGWEVRLSGRSVVLLGEKHDNAEQHRLRLAVLRRAVDRGWRPAVAMEQFDIERQDDIDRARRERPGDADHLIREGTPARAGWDWALYRPVLELLLAHELPLVAANLSQAAAGRVIRSDYASVFGTERTRELGLDRPLPPALLAAQQREVDAGHCGALPAGMLPGMARAQIARDAVMAERLRRHAGRGVVLLAGNGHVRRDIGVPRWLEGLAPQRVLAVGFLEEGEAAEWARRFDAVVVAPPATRDADPCARFRAPQGPRSAPGLSA